MIFYSSPTAAEAPESGTSGSVEIDALARLLVELTEATAARGVAFVQAMLPVGAVTDKVAFVRAGYSRLAQLIYMERMPGSRPADKSSRCETELEWVPFSPGIEDKLANVLVDTYVDSADCPGLAGLRRIEDVIAGHKSAGVFIPENWWLPECGGKCVGCVIVNESTDRDGAADLVYLGVRPAWRRRGFAREMLRYVLTRAGQVGLKKITLAVDAANIPAVRLYRQEGFSETDRREIFIKRGS